MGILDKLKNKATTRLSPKAAMYLSAVTLLGADGDIDDEDWSMIFEFRDQHGISKGDEDAALAFYDSMTNNYFPCIEKVAESLNHKQRLYTLSWLASLVSAKENAAAEEDDGWGVFVEVFGVDDATADGIAFAISSLSGAMSFE